MITIIVGFIGSGKTYLTVKLLHEEMDRHKPIYTNIRLKGPIEKRVTYLDDDGIRSMKLEELENCILVIDEANKVWNARAYKQNAEFSDNFKFLTYSRKRGVDVVLISQALNQMDKQIRDLAQQVYVIINLHTYPIISHLFKFIRFYKRYEDGTRVGMGMFFLGKYYDSYNTLQLPGGDDAQVKPPKVWGKKLFKITLTVFLLMMFVTCQNMIKYRAQAAKAKIEQQRAIEAAKPVQKKKGFDLAGMKLQFQSLDGQVVTFEGGLWVPRLPDDKLTFTPEGEVGLNGKSYITFREFASRRGNVLTDSEKKQVVLLAYEKYSKKTN